MTYRGVVADWDIIVRIMEAGLYSEMKPTTKTGI